MPKFAFDKFDKWRENQCSYCGFWHKTSKWAFWQKSKYFSETMLKMIILMKKCVWDPLLRKDAESYSKQIFQIWASKANLSAPAAKLNLFFQKNCRFFDFSPKNLKVFKNTENTPFLDFFRHYEHFLTKKYFLYIPQNYSSEKIHVQNVYVKNFRCHKIIFRSPRQQALIA